MKWQASFLTMAVLVLAVRGMTLTHWIPANDKACFYVDVDTAGKKISFYFGVESGGNHDIDYVVTDPAHQVLFAGKSEKHGDFVFTALDVGEYSVCFTNYMSTFAEKLVDFDIAVESDVDKDHVDPKYAQIRKTVIGKVKVGPQPKGAQSEDAVGYESERDEDESIMLVASRLKGHMEIIMRDMNHLKVRDHRHLDTILSTQSRIFWFAIAESVAIVGVAGLQVLAIHMFFRPSKSRF